MSSTLECGSWSREMMDFGPGEPSIPRFDTDLRELICNTEPLTSYGVSPLIVLWRWLRLRRLFGLDR